MKPCNQTTENIAWCIGFIFLFSSIVTGKKAIYVDIKKPLLLKSTNSTNANCSESASREYLLAWAYQVENKSLSKMHIENAKFALNSCKENNLNELQKRIKELSKTVSQSLNQE